MKKPHIDAENIKCVYDNRFLKLYEMSYYSGKPYIVASRRPVNELAALVRDDDFKNIAPDAVTCVVILRVNGSEPLLYMEREFRYPVGQFLMSPPAGLIDKSDEDAGNAVIRAAVREIKEETGIDVKKSDKIEIVSPVFFSSPGMTDESNALVCAVVDLPDLSSLTNDGAESTECFDGYVLLNEAEARDILKTCRDEFGCPFSVYTWACLMYFVSGMWC